VNDKETPAYIDFGSAVTIIREQELKRLGLKCCTGERQNLRGYGGGRVSTMGTTEFKLEVDSASAIVKAVVVPSDAQIEPLIVGRTFTELPSIEVAKDENSLTFTQRRGEESEPTIRLIKAPSPLDINQVKVGNVEENQKDQLIKLLNEFRDCFACSIEELGCAKSERMVIQLTDDTPFSHRPYRMSASEIAQVKKIVDELLECGIVRESQSEYASPSLLVQKKNGELRLVVDYRRLNSQTVKGCHPLPRIDDQVDRLTGGACFISLDLRSGYYQITLDEESRKYTSFVTPHGQWEWTKMPFGLTNAPRVFQRYMNRILKPVQDIAAVYLDDILIHAKTPEEATEGLRRVLEILRTEGLTLNLAKCTFLTTTVEFLGFEINEGMVRPGGKKTEAVRDFPTPKTVHHVRQFLGLTGYFRHFVKGYAAITRSLTQLLKKDQVWRWTDEEEAAFQKLKIMLVERPVLALHKPGAMTEVHTDASALGVAGILLQKQDDGKLHPVAYYSRQTSEAESKYHSYELETLAVVESLKKFRSYLIGVQFTVVTDCNSLKASSSKKELIPRIARWWLQLQEYTFEVQYRPGERMKHADALSRNPSPLTKEEEEDAYVLRIEPATWVLSAQLTDPKVQDIKEVLSRPPVTEKDRFVYSHYTLRQDRVYRVTPRGLLWLVPRGMRHEVVKIAHEAVGHCGTDKTMWKIGEAYWFPNMRNYVDAFIKCCIPCLYSKRKTGKAEGFLNPIPKGTEPLKTVHVDHLGPFPRSKKRNAHLIVAVDAFTKFTFIKAVRSTDTKAVIEYLRDLFCTYGVPEVLVTDRGTAFTAKRFENFCDQNKMRHVKVAVGTPRANGQVERLNRSILDILLTTEEENRWDEQVRAVQFAINNTRNQSTKKTPSELLLGYISRGGEDVQLRDEVVVASKMLEDVVAARQEAAENIGKAQERQKTAFDQHRKPARLYAEGDQVLVERPERTIETRGQSKKLVKPFRGPLEVVKVLPNDRYMVKEVDKKRGRRYMAVMAADKMKPWRPAGGVSDESANESGEEVEALPH
jgi:hypothetical protein